MPVRIENDVIYLNEQCSIEEAESLYEALKGIAQPQFDISNAGYLHSSIVQLIMACSGVVMGAQSDPVLAACFRTRTIS